ncbi:MAG: ATP-dependent protease ATPase subunit HslU [Bacteroidetes bacterium]|jgi:ATP-dependent HslUV protease ATP-binding subunit HslU|nr:ATP-dependent protease ATPase subunit HslU [Bacteroidota bacterium]
MTNELTPRQIVDALDRYIIGQEDAKKNVAIALRNRWRRRHAPEDMRDEIMPNNIIMIGPTGVGKTEIARRLAKLSGAPFIKVEASKFTEVGYVGRDVDSMIRDLTDIAINIVREEHEEEVQERARELAEERILDALLPSSPQTKPSKKSSGVSGPGFVISSDVNGDDSEEESTPASRTRERFRTMLRAGDMDDREIEIEVSGSDQSSMLQVFGPMGMEEMGMNLQELFGNLGGGKKKKRRVEVQNAWDPLQQEEAQKLIDMEKVKSEALDRVQQSGIVFIDEIDKVTVRSSSRGGNGGGQDVSRQGVQRDLLPVVEGANVTTKHGMVKTDHILFIASGAFHVAKPSDLIPELQGRFPIRVELNNLDADDFFRILTEPRNALIKQYRALMQSEGVEIEFTEDAIREVARTAAEVNAEVENIGARRLHTILTTLLEDILFDIPDTVASDHVVIDKDMVEAKLADIVADRDLSQYIL